MGASIFTLPEHTFLIEFEYWSLFYKNLPVLCGFSGVLLSLLLSGIFRFELFNFKMSSLGYSIYLFFNRKWYFDLIFNHYILNKFLEFGYLVTFKLIDKGVLDKLGPKGLYTLSLIINRSIISLQSGVIYHYALLMFLSLLILICSMLFINVFPNEALLFVKFLSFCMSIFVLSKVIR